MLASLANRNAQFLCHLQELGIIGVTLQAEVKLLADFSAIAGCAFLLYVSRVELAQFLRIFDDRQLCFHTEPIRDTTDLLCSTVGNCAQFFVIVKRDGIDNDVVMYMSFINMSCYYKLIFSFCEFQR